MSKEKKNVPKLRFPSFTDAWEQRKLGEVLDDLYNGQTPSRLREDYWNGTINWLSSGELNRGIVCECVEKITTAGQESAHLRVVPAGTFVMAITGLEAAGTRGNCAILGLDTTLNQSCMALFPNKEMLIPEYLFQWYRMVGEDYGIRFTQGTKQQSYNAEIIKSLEITLPSVQAQKQIANLLSKFDETISLHQRKLSNLKDYKKAMLQKMFPRNGEKVPEIRFPGFEGEWEQRRLGDTVSLRGRIGFRGYTQNDLVGAGEGAITFSPADIDEAGNVSLEDNKYLSWEKYEESPEIKVQVGDILFTKTASIGKVGYVRELNEKATINPQFALFTPNENTNGYFTFLSVRNDDFMKQVRNITGGSSVPTMSQEKLKELTFMVPTIEEQDKIGDYFSSLDNLIALHQRKLEQMKEYKKGLLQQMFV